jgi:hypothetical protein
MLRFNREKLNDVEVKEQCQVKISSRFAVLENLSEMMILVGLRKPVGYIKASATESLGYYDLEKRKTAV